MSEEAAGAPEQKSETAQAAGQIKEVAQQAEDQGVEYAGTARRAATIVEEVDPQKFQQEAAETVATDAAVGALATAAVAGALIAATGGGALAIGLAAGTGAAVGAGGGAAVGAVESAGKLNDKIENVKGEAVGLTINVASIATTGDDGEEMAQAGEDLTNAVSKKEAKQAGGDDIVKESREGGVEPKAASADKGGIGSLVPSGGGVGKSQSAGIGVG